MEKTNINAQKQLTALIEFWWTRSNCNTLLNRLWEYAQSGKVKNEAATQYERQFKGVSKFLLDVAKELVPKMPIKIESKYIKRLLWLILTVPLGEVDDQSVPFKSIELKGIFTVYEKMFLKLIEEAHFQRFIEPGCNQVQLFNALKACLKLLDEEIDKVCLKEGIKRITPTMGVYSFYAEKKDSVLFRHFSLAFQAYYYFKVINNLNSSS